MNGHRKATGGPKQPLVPGFPATLVSRCFIGTVKNMDMLINTMYLELQLVRGLGLGYTRVKSASSTDVVLHPQML